ncbi:MULTISPECIES: hypothetical protein [unclassified Beijerinckia]|uniref:hypothetical protein n=1 Tax=unclassified Beijerinckia TaxID=2638183 RepID=UPI00089C2CAB|nr:MULTISPECIES: hypothetical protein [unclassified Beijerinckia]MDH7794271.1 hypothetical protein [Beijerinckia sp. GAS462]SEB57430.1 hypothetical protein SAMN05443249_0540 [Beijerinckia sp. 28-YEA-48]
MSDARSRLLDNFAHRPAIESFTIESGPAFFETTKGERTTGYATVLVSRSSMTIRFAPDAFLAVTKAAYGEANGRIGAVNGAWLARRVNDARRSAAGDQLFVTQEVAMDKGAAQDAVATRLIFAGAAWRGTELLDGRKVIITPLSKEPVNHHDARVSITVEGSLDEATIETIGRASSFVAGIDLELLRVETISAQGDVVGVRHLRGFRRVGRGPHCPFTDVADEHRMRAWVALVQTIPRLEKEGFPIVAMINYIASHNLVAEINSSAPLLLLASHVAAYHFGHGSALLDGAISRRPEMQLLNRELNLGLRDEDLDRYEKLRIELLDAGYFHKPGYETGRPQKDIKFLRDIAHKTVLRLCGYSGPFYGAETFVTQVLAEQVS